MADDEKVTQLRESLSEGRDPSEVLNEMVGESDRLDETTQLSARDIRRKVANRKSNQVNEQESETENALEDLAQTDFSDSDESMGRMLEIMDGIGFSDDEIGQDFMDDLNVFVSCWAVDNDVIGQENVPDDLIDQCD